ncbi:hypothetical protein FACS1894110_09860 [Spirochaetia bacterium]|nr:hypothetical protein FACS1894110_09860 [Spirochaetia bacterium]
MKIIFCDENEADGIFKFAEDCLEDLKERDESETMQFNFIQKMLAYIVDGKTGKEGIEE